MDNTKRLQHYCKKCGSKAVKDGKRQIRRKGVDKKVQAFICRNAGCRYQWADEAYESALELQRVMDKSFARLRGA